MMEFTNEELYEIEKAFDERAAQVGFNTGIVLERLGKTKYTEADEFSRKILKESSHCWDMFRSISGKASKMRYKS